MLNSISTKVVLPIVGFTLLLAGCSKDSDEPDTAMLSSDQGILSFVPADSPYVLANAQPLPDDLLDKLEPKTERLMASYRSMLRAVINEKQRELSEEEADSEKLERANAVIDELLTLLSVEGMRGAGIGRESTGVLYGNGLLPVARISLSDGALFEDALARLEGEAGEELPQMAIGGHSVRYFDAEELRILIGVINEHAVFTVAPSVFDEDQLGEVLGLEPPKNSIADSGVLQEIAKEYGYTSHYVGFVDVEAIADRFVGNASGLDAALLALMDNDSADLSDVCRNEIRAVAGIVPRVVMGYNKLSLDVLESNIVFELRDDIAAGLKTLPSSVPGLGGDKGGLMSFGISLNVKAARDFMEARLDAMEDEPFECEHFADLQASVAGGRQTLNQPVPPMVYDFKGFLAVIDDVQGLDIATQTPPTSVDGSFLLAMENAQALVAMGAMFSPEVAGLNLQPDGKPVPLALPQLQMMGMAAYAALTDDALAIAIGEDSEDKLDNLLGGNASDQSPFMSFSMDAGRYYGFLGEAMAMEQSDDENAPSPEMAAAVQEVMESIAEVYDRMTIDIHFTDRGVEMLSNVTLQD